MEEVKLLRLWRSERAERPDLLRYNNNGEPTTNRIWKPGPAKVVKKRCICIYFNSNHSPRGVDEKKELWISLNDCFKNPFYAVPQ